MSYIRETEMSLELPRLCYEADRMEVVIGKTVLPVDNSLVSKWPGEIAVNQPGENDYETAAVCINLFGAPIGTKKLHGWLKKAMDDPVLRESMILDTVGVMRDVFSKLQPDIELPNYSHGGHIGFNVAVDERSHVTLHTFGNCACLGPNPTGAWVDYKDWDDGDCEYTFHNIDIDVQMWSLVAGLGHLACLADK